MSDTHEAPAHPQRLHALDGLRGVAMLLGVVLHAGMVYVPVSFPGFILDAKRSNVIMGILGVIHSFRMQLFFVVAGFFAAMIYQRRGAAAFLKHRTRRLLWPFIAGVVLIMPFVGAMIAHRITRNAFVEYPARLAPGHLWFLEYLFLHCVMAYAFARWTPAETRAKLAGWLDGLTRRVIASRWKPALLALPSGVALYFSPYWTEIEAPLPGLSFVPTPRAVMYYGFYFLFGWLLHRQADVFGGLQGSIWGRAALALVAFPIMFAFFLSWATLQGQAQAWPLKVAGIWLHELVTWLWIFACFSFFLRYCAQPRPVLRYLADASYWIYLLHLPLVLWLQNMAGPWEVGVWTKYGFVYGVTMAISLASYQLFVRHTVIGVFLNGRRGANSHGGN